MDFRKYSDNSIILYYFNRHHDKKGEPISITLAIICCGLYAKNKAGYYHPYYGRGNDGSE